MCDASFIGLATILPAPLALCAPGRLGGRADQAAVRGGGGRRWAKGGVVRDPAVHAAVCARVHDWWAAQPGWRVLGIIESPITGPEGNREFLIAAARLALRDDIG